MTIKINAITEKENTNENIGLLLNKLLDGRMYEIYTIICALQKKQEQILRLHGIKSFTQRMMVEELRLEETKHRQFLNIMAQKILLN